MGICWQIYKDMHMDVASFELLDVFKKIKTKKQKLIPE